MIISQSYGQSKYAWIYKKLTFSSKLFLFQDIIDQRIFVEPNTSGINMSSVNKLFKIIGTTVILICLKVMSLWEVLQI